MKKLIAILAFMAICSSTIASPSSIIFEEVGEIGESKSEFLHRIGPKMRAWSDTSRHEACAAIASDGQRFGALVTSSGSHIACETFHRNVPAGMSSTGETIHTHGTDELIRANMADRRIAGIGLGEKIYGQHLDKFSPTDYQESGYLAAPNGKIFYQNGRGTQKEIVH